MLYNIENLRVSKETKPALKTFINLDDHKIGFELTDTDEIRFFLV